MKRCLILLAVLMAVIILSKVTENKDVEMPENVIAINNAEGENSPLQDKY